MSCHWDTGTADQNREVTVGMVKTACKRRAPALPARWGQSGAAAKGPSRLPAHVRNLAACGLKRRPTLQLFPSAAAEGLK